jgi:hypothetical protein
MFYGDKMIAPVDLSGGWLLLSEEAKHGVGSC